jgi:hypothetical protein
MKGMIDMKKVINKDIILYGEEQGEVVRYKTLWDAYYGYKEIRKQDKEENTGFDAKEYYWIFEVTFDDNTFTEREIKFYVRKGKMYLKYI